MQGIPNSIEQNNWGHSQNWLSPSGQDRQSFAGDFGGPSGDLTSVRKWECYLRDDRRRSERTISTYVRVVDQFMEFVSPQSIYTVNVEQMMASPSEALLWQCGGSWYSEAGCCHPEIPFPVGL